MKKLFGSSKGRYAVNVLLAVFFGVLAVTGLFFLEDDGGREGGHNRRHADIQKNSVFGEEVEMQEYASFGGIESFKGGADFSINNSKGLHQITGIIWLVLMSIHIWQHWNWHKNMFSRKQILANKLLSTTTVLFVLLLITSVGLLTKSFPHGFIDLKEIHSLLGQLVVGLVIIHFIQRFKWYVTCTKKLFARTVASKK